VGDGVSFASAGGTETSPENKQDVGAWTGPPPQKKKRETRFPRPGREKKAGGSSETVRPGKEKNLIEGRNRSLGRRLSKNQKQKRGVLKREKKESCGSPL